MNIIKKEDQRTTYIMGPENELAVIHEPLAALYLTYYRSLILLI